MINDFTEEDEEKTPDLSAFPELERELLKDATPTEIRSVARLSTPDLERMLVGHLVWQPISATKPNLVPAEKMIEVGMAKEWFEDKLIGKIFANLMDHFRQKRTLMTVDEVYSKCLVDGYDVNIASNLKNIVVDCHAVALVKAIDIDILIDRMFNHHRMLRQNEIIERAQKERADPNIGPKKSFENMREACIKDMLDPRGATIKSFDLVADSKESIEWLKDMKYHPEKYRGMRCGIECIDSKTLGFRPGQLCVFVGYHGGYKTTTMLNVGYGLYENGCNVLFVSLEMEPQIVQTKLLCRGTNGAVNYSRVYNGKMIEPEDFDRLNELSKAIIDSATSLEDRTALILKRDELSAVLKDKTKNDADITKANEFFAKMAKKPQKFVIATIGQSEKMKLSQLERWLREQVSTFKPDVVILDYLDLLQPEVVNPNRLDVGFGDICKMSRQMGKNMGFSVITAAQMKRAAVERLRKTGFDTPEKAQFGTDDISGSGQIGADADNAFVLWRKNQNEVQLFTIKSRYSVMDNTVGDTLQVDYDSCTIAERGKIQGCGAVAGRKSMGDADASIEKLFKKPAMGGNEDLDCPFEPDSITEDKTGIECL